MTLIEKEEQAQAAANALWQRKAEGEQELRLQAKYRRVYSALSKGRNWFHGKAELTHSFMANGEPECRNDPVSTRDCFVIGMYGPRLYVWVEYFDELDYWDNPIGRHMWREPHLVVLPEQLIPLYKAMRPDDPDISHTWPWNLK